MKESRKKTARRRWPQPNLHVHSMCNFGFVFCILFSTHSGREHKCCSKRSVVANFRPKQQSTHSVKTWDVISLVPCDDLFPHRTVSFGTAQTHGIQVLRDAIKNARSKLRCVFCSSLFAYCVFVLLCLFTAVSLVWIGSVVVKRKNGSREAQMYIQYKCVWI